MKYKGNLNLNIGINNETTTKKYIENNKANEIIKLHMKYNTSNTTTTTIATPRLPSIQENAMVLGLNKP